MAGGVAGRGIGTGAGIKQNDGPGGLAALQFVGGDEGQHRAEEVTGPVAGWPPQWEKNTARAPGRRSRSGARGVHQQAGVAEGKREPPKAKPIGAGFTATAPPPRLGVATFARAAGPRPATSYRFCRRQQPKAPAARA
ncbi:hypothetical protein GCM10022406_15410 [Hymenobacter algoricola]|uniref:Uncharacterized protein n=1 Tax=Hymenobacter algoricola TaxID=486267 RepID=A0ABP7MVP5_9BACT